MSRDIIVRGNLFRIITNIREARAAIGKRVEWHDATGHHAGQIMWAGGKSILINGSIMRMSKMYELGFFV